MNTRDVLLVVAGAGALGAVFYAVNAAAKPTAPSTPSTPISTASVPFTLVANDPHKQYR